MKIPHDSSLIVHADMTASTMQFLTNPEGAKTECELIPRYWYINTHASIDWVSIIWKQRSWQFHFFRVTYYKQIDQKRAATPCDQVH